MNSLERRGSTYVIAGWLLWLVVHLACAFMGDVTLGIVLLGTVIAVLGNVLCNYFVTWRGRLSRSSRVAAISGLLMWLWGWSVLIGGTLSSPTSSWVNPATVVSVLGAVTLTLIFIGTFIIFYPKLYDVPVFWGFVLVCILLTGMLSNSLPVRMNLSSMLPVGTVVPEASVFRTLVSLVPIGAIVYFVHARLSPPKDCDYESNFDIVRGLSSLFLSTKGFVWGKIK